MGLVSVVSGGGGGGSCRKLSKSSRDNDVIRIENIRELSVVSIY